MKKIAYGINAAARATGTDAKTIADAVACRELAAVQINGKPKIPCRWLRKWVETRPNWYPAN